MVFMVNGGAVSPTFKVCSALIRLLLPSLVACRVSPRFERRILQTEEAGGGDHPTRAPEGPEAIRIALGAQGVMIEDHPAARLVDHAQKLLHSMVDQRGAELALQVGGRTGQ